jgi:hypothetical protein
MVMCGASCFVASRTGKADIRTVGPRIRLGQRERQMQRFKLPLVIAEPFVAHCPAFDKF